LADSGIMNRRNPIVAIVRDATVTWKGRAPTLLTLSGAGLEPT